MKLGSLHHVGIAVLSIDGLSRGVEAALTGSLATDSTHEHRSEIEDDVVAFLGEGRQRLELIEPTDQQSGVARFLAEQGRPTLHHVCYVVEDLAATLRSLDRDGVELIDRAPRRGAEGMVAFIHPRASGGILIELIDRASLGDSIP